MIEQQFHRSISALIAELKTKQSVCKLAIACSGGGDSMALSHLLIAWQKIHAPQLKIEAIIVDHRLRPESVAEAKLAQSWLKELGIVSTILSPKYVPASSQNKAREIRYRLIDEWAAENAIDALVLAHHADDQLETLYMRLIKQSGFKGLIGMNSLSRPSEQHIWRLRPMLDCSRKDIETYLKRHKITYVEDPSNHNLKFERVWWRQHGKRFEQAGFKDQSLQRLRIIAKRFDQFETELFCKIATEVMLPPPDHHINQLSGLWIEFDPYRLAKFPINLQIQFLRHLWHIVSGTPYPPKQKKIYRLLQSINEGQSGGSLAGLLWHRRKTRNTIFVVREPAAMMKPVQLKASVNTVILWDHRYKLILEPELHAVLSQKTQTPIYFGATVNHPPDLPYPKLWLKSLPCLLDHAGNPLYIPAIGFIDPSCDFIENAPFDKISIRFITESPLLFLHH